MNCAFQFNFTEVLDNQEVFEKIIQHAGNILARVTLLRKARKLHTRRNSTVERYYNEKIRDKKRRK